MTETSRILFPCPLPIHGLPPLPFKFLIKYRSPLKWSCSYRLLISVFCVSNAIFSLHIQRPSIILWLHQLRHLIQHTPRKKIMIQFSNHNPLLIAHDLFLWSPPSPRNHDKIKITLKNACHCNLAWQRSRHITWGCLYCLNRGGPEIRFLNPKTTIGWSVACYQEYPWALYLLGDEIMVKEQYSTTKKFKIPKRSNTFSNSSPNQVNKISHG